MKAKTLSRSAVAVAVAVGVEVPIGVRVAVGVGAVTVKLLAALHASTNNRADTVLRVFLNATGKYGVPYRVRGDRGGENIEVSVWMIKYRGPNRGSFTWGTYVGLIFICKSVLRNP